MPETINSAESFWPNDMIFTFTLDPKALGGIKIFRLNILLLPTLSNFPFHRIYPNHYSPILKTHVFRFLEYESNIFVLPPCNIFWNLILSHLPNLVSIVRFCSSKNLYCKVNNLKLIKL